VEIERLDFHRHGVLCNGMGNIASVGNGDGNPSSDDAYFSLSLEGYQEREKIKIMGGYVLKLGKLLAGTHRRFVVLFTDLTLHSCKSEEEDESKHKIYNLSNSQIAWGRLATNEYAIRITTLRPKGSLTLLFDSTSKMQQWVGGIRCMYAGTDRFLCKTGTLGGDTCTICISDFDDGQHISVLPCEHRFCPECIKRWFQVSTLCPCCKRDAMQDGALAVRPGRFRGVDHCTGGAATVENREKSAVQALK
jgi:hypothetical protein